MAQQWMRFQPADSAFWDDWPEWPGGDARAILVYNACDGFHIWNRGFSVPPGTHWAHLPDRPQEAIDDQRRLIERSRT